MDLFSLNFWVYIWHLGRYIPVIRYQSWTAFQEQNFCCPKMEIYLNFPTLERSVCNMTNHITCFVEPLKSDLSDCLFCKHLENFGWHKPCWAVIGIWAIIGILYLVYTTEDQTYSGYMYSFEHSLCTYSLCTWATLVRLGPYNFRQSLIYVNVWIGNVEIVRDLLFL